MAFVSILISVSAAIAQTGAATDRDAERLLGVLRHSPREAVAQVRAVGGRYPSKPSIVGVWESYGGTIDPAKGHHYVWTPAKKGVYRMVFFEGDTMNFVYPNVVMKGNYMWESQRRLYKVHRSGMKGAAYETYRIGDYLFHISEPDVLVFRRVD